MMRESVGGPILVTKIETYIVDRCATCKGSGKAGEWSLFHIRAKCITCFGKGWVR